MKAGRLDHRLRFLRPVTAESGTGSKAAGWESTGEGWAERRRIAARGIVDAAEIFDATTAEFIVSDGHRVAAHWRVEQLYPSGDLYDVVAVEPNRRRGYLLLRCEKVNL